MKLKPLRSALQGAYQSVKNLMPVSASIWDDKLLAGLKAELIISDELIKSQLTLINYLKKLTEDLTGDKKAALYMNDVYKKANSLLSVENESFKEVIKSEAEKIVNFIKEKNAAVLIMDQLRYELANSNLNCDAFQELADTREREIIALKAIVAGIRKQKRYSGQKYYNPNNHKAETIYLCARWNDYYMISIGRYNVPNIITAAEFNETYAGYEIIPSTNQNAKLLNHD